MDKTKFASRKFGLAGVAFTALMAAEQPILAVVVTGIYMVTNAAEKFSR